MDREKGDEIRHELDDAFASLRDLIYAPVASTSTLQKEGVPINETTALDPLANLAPQDTNYDQHVRELAFDKRAKPTDRTKSEEELAREEKEALEKAERKRQKRMQGLDDDSDSDEDEQPKKGKRKRAEADDLDDDLVDEDEEGWGGIGTGLAEASKTGASEDDDDEGSDGDDDEEEGSDEEVGEEDGEEDFGGDLSEQEELTTAKPSKAKKAKPAKNELPFTFACPSTHEEFLEIVDGIDDSDISTVVERIRKLHHTSLAPENKFKLQVSFCTLL